MNVFQVYRRVHLNQNVPGSLPVDYRCPTHSTWVRLSFSYTGKWEMDQVKRVLVAVRESDQDLVTTILGGCFDIQFVYSLRTAEASIDEQVGLIVCGVHFDHGSMFDFLRFVKAHPVGCRIPFFLVLREDTSHPLPVIKGIKGAATLLGADEFIDLGELRMSMDTQEMFEGLREKAHRALSSSR